MPGPGDEEGKGVMGRREVLRDCRTFCAIIAQKSIPVCAGAEHRFYASGKQL
jgi:hypothetical protein